MSKKKTEQVLMFPGATGWEVWKGTTEAGFGLIEVTEHAFALEVEKLPGNSVNFAIPVRQLTALPFHAQTEDLALLGDLATMHLERHGMRPSLEGGELADYFIYSAEGDQSILTPVVMNQPVEGELPRRSPDAFDVSPRCLPLRRNAVLVWQELGRWVMALGDGERLLYFQCLSGEILDDRAGSEISLALTQLRLQGVLTEAPNELVVWTSGGPTDPRSAEVEKLSKGAALNTTVEARPAPHWPTPPSRLLPADVRAERLALRNRRNTILGVAAAFLAYCGIFGYFAWEYSKSGQEADRLEAELKSLGPGTQSLLEHQEKWDELSPVVESDFYPYEVFHRIVSSAPRVRGNNKPLRLTRAVITNQYQNVEGEAQVVRSVKLMGNAESTENVATFNLALKQSPDLAAFRWTDPPARRGKSGRWDFEYNGQSRPDESL